MTTPTPPPLTRLDRAKAALEEADRVNDAAWKAHVASCAAQGDAMRELADAEQEAAAQPQPVPPPLPDALVEVARFVSANSPYDTMCLHEVWKLLARSHGVSVDALRARLDADAAALQLNQRGES